MHQELSQPTDSERGYRGTAVGSWRTRTRRALRYALDVMPVVRDHAEPCAYAAIQVEIEALNVVRCRGCEGCASCSGWGLPGGMLVEVVLVTDEHGVLRPRTSCGETLPPACRASLRVIELERLTGYDLIPEDPDADAEISARMSRYADTEIAARGGMNSIAPDELRQICRDALERASDEVPTCVGPAWERELARVARVARQYLAGRGVRRIVHRPHRGLTLRVRSRVARSSRRARTVARAVARSTGDPDGDPEPPRAPADSSIGGAL